MHTHTPLYVLDKTAITLQKIGGKCQNYTMIIPLTSKALKVCVFNKSCEDGSIIRLENLKAWLPDGLCG
jgi:hypothetical protein